MRAARPGFPPRKRAVFGWQPASSFSITQLHAATSAAGAEAGASSTWCPAPAELPLPAPAEGQPWGAAQEPQGAQLYPDGAARSALPGLPQWGGRQSGGGRCGEVGRARSAAQSALAQPVCGWCTASCCHGAAGASLVGSPPAEKDPPSCCCCRNKDAILQVLKAHLTCPQGTVLEVASGGVVLLGVVSGIRLGH